MSEDLVATAARLLSENRYAVLATVDGSGAPWASPVWFAHRDLTTLVWVSYPEARHSQAIAAEPRLAVTVFDSSVEPGHGTAFYGRGRARRCPDAELAEHLAVFQAESERQGIGEWGADRVTGAARLRLYVATLDEVSLLLDDGGPDFRVPVDLDAS
ncbi:pyridoxamine 5'-phosphate oxidase family protein [Nocardioides sp.]|uniref:pyridoxamine 5'-phosphate oxidase family protein n=1 Tax=Nocardioides sp. TaxID=35761 RepID=UPI002ED023B1